MCGNIINKIILNMFPQHQRKASLQNLRTHKTTHLFPIQKKLPPISEARDLKKNINKQLTHAVTKFNHNNMKQALKHTDQLLRSSIAVLKAFSTTQNNFQSLFEELFEVFRRFCFTVDDAEILGVLSAYRIKQGYSYRKTLLMMDAELQLKMKQKNDKIKELNQNMASLQADIQAKQTNWNQQKQQLLAEIQRFKQLANQDYMVSLEELVETQKGQIQDLTNALKHSNSKNQELMEEGKVKDDAIHQFTIENAHLKTDVFDLSKKLDKIDGYFNNLKEKFDGLLVKMMGLKEVISKVEEENNNLVSQRAQLVRRAAVSFQELTPRPKYKEIFQIAMKSHINSTADIFTNIMEQTSLSNKQIVENIILKKKTYKLKEAEAIREKVVDDIIESKQKMKKFQK